MPLRTSRSTLITELTDLMCRVASAHATVTPPEAWMDADLSMPQVKAMLVLYHRSTIRIGNIAEELGMSKNAATALLDRMETLGLAERSADPSDRRAVLVTLTPRGAEFVNDILTAGSQSVTRFFEQMDDDDLNALHRGMSALAALIEREAAARQPQHAPMGSRA
jgi:DNA-binding MarR family transcriptional regulator